MFNSSSCDYHRSVVLESFAKPSLGCQFSSPCLLGLADNSRTIESGQSSLEELSLLFHIFSTGLPPDLSFSKSLIFKIITGYTINIMGLYDLTIKNPKTTTCTSKVCVLLLANDTKIKCFGITQLQTGFQMQVILAKSVRYIYTQLTKVWGIFTTTVNIDNNGKFKDTSSILL